MHGVKELVFLQNQFLVLHKMLSRERLDDLFDLVQLSVQLLPLIALIYLVYSFASHAAIAAIAAVVLGGLFIRGLYQSLFVSFRI